MLAQPRRTQALRLWGGVLRSSSLQRLRGNQGGAARGIERDPACWREAVALAGRERE